MNSEDGKTRVRGELSLGWAGVEITDFSRGRLEGYRHMFSRFEMVAVMLIAVICLALIADGLRWF